MALVESPPCTSSSCIKDVTFVDAGQDRICSGGDEQATGKRSFKEWMRSQDNYDLSRFVFLGLLKRQELAALFSLTISTST